MKSHINVRLAKAKVPKIAQKRDAKVCFRPLARVSGRSLFHWCEVDSTLLSLKLLATIAPLQDHAHQLPLIVSDCLDAGALIARKGDFGRLLRRGNMSPRQKIIWVW